MLEVKNLTVCYNDFLALNDISLKIQEGTLTGIIGPNGAGKSTLLKAMLNIIPHQGEVSINNEDINKKLVKIAYVEQKADIDFTFPIKVKECVSMGTYAGMKVFQRIKNNRITEGGSPVCKRFKKLCEVMSMFDVKVTEEQLRYAADMVE